MSGVKPVKRVSVGEQVFTQLKELLVQGEWKPGEKLPSENELAAQFGVSRITVRQALQKLGALGLVETRLGEGSFVKQLEAADAVTPLIPAIVLSRDTLPQVMEFREMLEIQSAALAARRGTPQQLERLESILEAMQRCIGDPQRFGMLDVEFHLQIGRMTCNDLVIRTQSILRETLQQAMNDVVQLTGYQPGLYYHGKLIEAFRSRDEAMAMQWMREHLEKNKTAYETEEEISHEL